MISVDTPVYPELRQLFGAYLNAEFASQYGTVANALAAYRAETGPGHRAAARAELDRLTAAPGALTRLHAELTGLVSSLTPRAHDEGAAWYQRPAAFGALVLFLVLILNIIFW